MKIRFSDFDRVLVAQAQREIPWQGVEDVVVARYKLGEALQLAAIEKALKGRPLEKIPHELNFTAELSEDLVELLVTVVAGGGAAIQGQVGPLLGELITRVRKVAPKKKEKAA